MLQNGALKTSLLIYYYNIWLKIKLLNEQYLYCTEVFAEDSKNNKGVISINCIKNSPRSFSLISMAINYPEVVLPGARG